MAIVSACLSTIMLGDLASLGSAAAHAGGPIVWTVPSLVRIGPADPPGSSIEASISAAKGEYESFQIVIRAPAGGLANVNVFGSDLTHSAGSHINNSNVTLYREYYVYVDRSSPMRGGPNEPMGAGWYADALIPFQDRTGADLSGALDAAPFDLAAETNAVVWVDVYVPRTTLPGEYKGHLSVTSDQGAVEVPVSVTVWDFALPRQPALDTAFLFWTMRTLEAQKELLRHRIHPLEVPPEYQKILIDDYGLKSTSLGFWSGADHKTCTLSPAPSVDSIRTEMARHQPELQLYNFTADEIDDCVGVHSSVREWGRNLHLAGAVQNLVVTVPNPALFDDGTGSGRSAVDIWVVLPRHYDEYISLVRQAQAKGDAIWSYNALVQDDYSPKWLIDYSPINFRIMSGFINQRLGLEGMLYWRIDRWQSDPWNEINNAGRFGSHNYPGEGMLVYPGEPVGLPGSVVASMRLKWLRDGVDDFDYVELLKLRGQEEWALAVVGAIAPDWANWTRDIGALETTRTALAQRLQHFPVPRGRLRGRRGN
jgi:hypothetical protein